jgi:hypothetical protein
MACVVPCAPRYDPRILLLIEALDDRNESMAEVCRRVGAAAECIDLPRPSYVHVRRLLMAARSRRDTEQRRRQALREIAADVATDLVLGRLVNAYEVADRVADARELGPPQ